VAAPHVHNRRARHEYHIDEQIEAGLQLQGWEVKAFRAGQVSLAEGFARLDRGELWLLGVTFTPLITASTHVLPVPQRPRKLLLHRQEIDRWMGLVERKGYTLIPLDMHLSKGKIKVAIGLARGKQQHDKRADAKEKEIRRELRDVRNRT
jgi:SsrA-binding protein